MATAPKGTAVSALRACLILFKAETASRSPAASFLLSCAHLGLNRNIFGRLKYFVIVRAHVASACPCVGADTDAVRLCPPRVESGIPAAAPDHSSSPAIRAHAYRARCQPHTVQNSCQMRLRASNRTPNKDSPSDSRLQRLEGLFASPWAGGLLVPT